MLEKTCLPAIRRDLPLPLPLQMSPSALPPSGSLKTFDCSSAVKLRAKPLMSTELSTAITLAADSARVPPERLLVTTRSTLTVLPLRRGRA